MLLQLAKFVSLLDPTHLLVAFDTPGGCPARRELDPGYKATRSAPAADLVSQLAWAPAVLRQLGIAVAEDANWEADDILASSVTHARASGMAVALLTSDRDAYQLLAEDVTLHTPDGKTLTPKSLLDTYGVSPNGYALLAALRGEPSDNLPGVPGVGAKTAAKLAATYESLEEIIAASDEELRCILGPKALTSLRENVALAQRSFAVARPRTDLAVDLTATALQKIPVPELRESSRRLGLEAAGRKVAEALSRAHRPI
jgi:DNA polymerase-1